MKPGIVLSSLTRNPRPYSSKKKSTRAIPSQRSALNASIESRCTVSTSVGVNGAGINRSAVSFTYFSS